MVNPTGKKLEKLLFGIFDEAIQGVDTYNHNGSMWLIFTDEMKWVVEYTKSQTLWYNYYFFKNEMEIIGLDCVENKDLIQKWFESRFLNKNGVKDTLAESIPDSFGINDAIQNGVKDTSTLANMAKARVEYAIQNGVKHTLDIADGYQSRVEDTIQNGVKKIRWNGELGTHLCEDVIKNGVKHTESLPENNSVRIQDTVKYGVKEILQSDFYRKSRITDVTQNGVKKI